MTNFDLTQQIFDFLKFSGIDTVVLCAGARNAPFVMALEEQKFKVYSFFEERSASFFALGLIKSGMKPVAVLTTSGTAAAELLPAVIEAHYQGLPLVVVTADRPKSYRGTGSPQTIEQAGLFKNYVESEYDLDANTAMFHFEWGGKRPIHFNVSFDEPLIDRPGGMRIPVNIIRSRYSHPENSTKFTGMRPLVILGEIENRYRDQVKDFLLGLRAPVYAESQSLLKRSAAINDLVLKSGEGLIRYLFKSEMCDSVIRIGSVPTLRFWRDLEKEFSDVPVLNYTDLPFSGISRETMMIEIEMLKSFLNFPPEILSSVQKLDQALEAEMELLLEKYPLSEPGLVRNLSRLIKRDPLYLGNSLPIREWDQFAKIDSKLINANRGANGIDGQISTYLGWSENLVQSYCLVGDLTAMYDLASLGLTPQLHKRKRFVMVMNNFGGQIFSRIFESEKFLNRHNTQFYHWAKMWNWSYLIVQSEDDFKKIHTFNTPNVVVEIVPDPQQTSDFWDEWDLICCSI